MMEFLFNATISISVISVAIILMRMVFHQKVAPVFIYALWVLLLVRLAFPMLPISKFSVFNYLPMAISEGKSVYHIDEMDVQDTSYEATYDSFAKSKFSSSQDERDYILLRKTEINLILKIWLIGAGMLFVYFNIGNLYFKRKIRAYEKCVDEDVLEIMRRCKKDIGLKKKVLVRYYDGSPVVRGFLHPIILIPKGYSHEELVYIFTHELYHVKHMDYCIDYVAIIVLCLNWFNPFLWISFIMMKKDAELYCDRSVISVRESRREYATLLLKTATMESYAYPLASYIGNHKKDVKRRIHLIAHHSGSSKGWKVVFTLCMVSFLFLFLTNQVSPAIAKDKGKVPIEFRENIESTVSNHEEGSKDVRLVYLCEDETYIYSIVDFAKDGQTYTKFYIYFVSEKTDLKNGGKKTLFEEVIAKGNTDECQKVIHHNGETFYCGKRDVDKTSTVHFTYHGEQKEMVLHGEEAGYILRLK